MMSYGIIGQLEKIKKNDKHRDAIWHHLARKGFINQELEHELVENERDETLSSEDDFLEIGEITVVEDTLENQPVNPINNFVELEIPELAESEVDTVEDENVEEHYEEIENIPVRQEEVEPRINVENENDFIIPEDREINIWQEFINETNDDTYEVPFVQVPHNLAELYPQQDEQNICGVCRVAERTHALVPCGHRVLCIDCLGQLQATRCPICNEDFNLALRIW